MFCTGEAMNTLRAAAFILALGLTGAGLFASSPATAQLTAIEGKPRVIDGDTIEISGERIRLEGIDTPEKWQKCRDERGSEYRCGQDATDALRRLIGYSPVRCELEPGRDRYGRLIGFCFTASGTDINGWLVREGLALAYRQYSRRYVYEEERAQRGKRGMHRGEFVPPWDWRRGKRLTP